MSLTTNKLFLAIEEDGVLVHTTDTVRAAGIAEAGDMRSSGTPRDVYDRLKARVVVELNYKAKGACIDEDLLDHPMFVQVAELFIAARLLRYHRSYQEISDSLFAEANILLRQFYEDVAMVSEGGTGAAFITIDETEFGGAAANQPWLPNPNYTTEGWFEADSLKPRPPARPYKPR